MISYNKITFFIAFGYPRSGFIAPRIFSDVRTSAQCQDTCDVTIQCISWTFRRDDGTCLVKTQEEHCDPENRILPDLTGLTKSGMSTYCSKNIGGSFRSFLKCSCLKVS